MFGVFGCRRDVACRIACDAAADADMFFRTAASADFGLPTTGGGILANDFGDGILPLAAGDVFGGGRRRTGNGISISFSKPVMKCSVWLFSVTCY